MKPAWFQLRHLWFRPKTIGWGLTPVRWQGWAYAIGWGCAIALPSAWLLRGRKPIISLVWFSGTIFVLCVDTWFILRKIRRAAKQKELGNFESQRQI